MCDISVVSKEPMKSVNINIPNFPYKVVELLQYQNYTMSSCCIKFILKSGRSNGSTFIETNEINC